MRKLTRGAWGRSLAATTCFAFMVTTLLASVAVAPPKARAQIGGVESTVKPPPRAAVVDFKGPGGAMLGRRAADAVSIALKEMRGAPYTPEPPDAVAAAMAELGLVAPLDREGQQELAERLGVKWVISGEVRKATVAGGKAEVELLLTNLSVESGDYASGSRVRASSATHPGYRGDNDVLIDDALASGAREATRLLAGSKIPEASVLMVFGHDEVQLSAGKPAGFRQGMRLALLRLVEGHWRRVGTLEIRRAGNHDATAAIIADPLGIQTNDRVMAIWDPGQAQIGIASRPEKKGKASLSKGILALAGIIALIAGFKAHGKRAERRTSPTPTACALVDGDGVLITWSPPNDTVLAVEIWRLTGGLRTLVAVVGREGAYSSYFQQHRFVDTLLQPNGSLCINMENPDEDPVTVTYDSTIGTEDPCEGGDTAETSYAIIWGASLLTDGITATYQLVYIVKKKVQVASEVGGGSLPTMRWIITQWGASRASNPVTPLAPVTLVSPLGARGVDPTSAQFRFVAMGDPLIALDYTGANQYVVQISRDPTFAPAQTAEYPAPPNYHRAIYAPDTEVRLDINFSDMLTPAERAGCVTLFWRVGARNAADKCPPVAFPADPNRDGWVFGTTTNVGSFTAGDTCP
jgi:hypothetical protein